MNARPPEGLSLAAEEFQVRYLAELDSRVQRSEAVGAFVTDQRNAALFYDKQDDKFTLVEKLADVEEAAVFDSVPREQWGRQVLVFGHATHTGGYVASGHGMLTGNVLSIKLASGHHYRIDVEPTLPHLAPYFVEAPAKRTPEREPRPRRGNGRGPRGGRGQKQYPSQPETMGQDRAADNNADSDSDSDSDDFTAEDLKRLRGEIPLTQKKRRY
jgi:hypothetical protein